jgi:hypothetical protein
VGASSLMVEQEMRGNTILRPDTTLGAVNTYLVA